MDTNFNTCFRTYYQTMCHFAYGYLKDSLKAEDVVQLVFVKIIDNSELLGASEELVKNYLYKAVRNACLNEIKLGEIHQTILSRIQQDKLNEDNLIFHIIRSEIYQEIMKAVKELPPRCQHVFELAFIAQKTNEEIAEELHLSVNTVRVQKNKAKQVLQLKLKELYPLVLFVLNSRFKI